MPSSDRGLALVLLGTSAALVAPATRAGAQQQAEGFAVERFYPSAPGGGWFVMDSLDLHGGLGGAAGIVVNYAHDPLRVTGAGSQPLNVVSDQASADVGFAVTYDRFRLYVNLDSPLWTGGRNGSVGGYSFTAPDVDLGVTPDSLSDVRFGFDALVLGRVNEPFRFGLGAQLFVPNLYNDARADYDTDGTYRAMGRALFAGDVGALTYAGQLGVHVRPLDDSSTPGSPQGSELLFGVAAGAKLLGLFDGTSRLVIGPEFYGASAFRSFMSSTGTSLEGLLTARLEATRDQGPQLRLKLGAGVGLDRHLGAPEWRIVLAIEVIARSPKEGDR
jgi:hypothetical protein